MKVLSSIQNNLSGSFYNDQRNQKVVNNSEDDLDYLSDSQMVTKSDNAQKLLSTNEKSTLHMFFGTEVPEDMRLYGKNNIQQIHKGQLLDLQG